MYLSPLLSTHLQYNVWKWNSREDDAPKGVEDTPYTTTQRIDSWRRGTEIHER